MNKTDESIYIRLYAGNESRELSGDYILPDYMADIKKIVSVTPALRRSESSLADGILEYDGDIVYRMIYITEEDKLRGVSFGTSYDGSVAISGADDGCLQMLNPTLSFPAARLMNPRKVNIKCMLTLDISVYCRRQVQPMMTGAHNSEDELTLERRECELEAASLALVGGECIPISDDITLDASFPPLAEMIAVSPTVYIYDARIIDGKISYRGDAYVSCLYASEGEGGEGCNTITKKLPISGACDADMSLYDGNSEITSIVTVGPVKAEAQHDGLDEMRIIELDFSCEIKFICTKQVKIGIIDDIYSLDCECDKADGEYSALTQSKACRGNYSLGDTSTLAEVGIEGACEVLALDAYIAGEASYDNAKGKLLYTGNVKYSVAAKKDDGSPITGSIMCPIKLELASIPASSDASYTAAASVIMQRCRLDRENITFDIEVGIEASEFGCGRVKLIDTITLRRGEIKKHNGGAYPITLYYPRPNEGLWEIAKRYNTTVNAIKLANSLTEDECRAGAVLVIPRGGAKPIMSKIV